MPLEVDGHHLVPFLGLDVFDERPGIDAGILHDDVEPAIGGDGFVHRPLRIGFLRNVSGDEAALEAFSGGAARFLFSVGDNDARAFLNKAFGNCSTYAARRRQ